MFSRINHRFRAGFLDRADNVVARFGRPHRDGIPQREMLLLDTRLLSRQSQKNVQLVGLKTSVRLELSTRTWKVGPVENSTDANRASAIRSSSVTGITPFPIVAA